MVVSILVVHSVVVVACPKRAGLAESIEILGLAEWRNVRVRRLAEVLIEALELRDLDLLVRGVVIWGHHIHVDVYVAFQSLNV